MLYIESCLLRVCFPWLIARSHPHYKLLLDIHFVVTFCWPQARDRCKEQEEAINQMMGNLDKLREAAQAEFDKVSDFCEVLHSFHWLNAHQSHHFRSIQPMLLHWQPWGLWAFLPSECWNHSGLHPLVWQGWCRPFVWCWMSLLPRKI